MSTSQEAYLSFFSEQNKDNSQLKIYPRVGVESRCILLKVIMSSEKGIIRNWERKEASINSLPSY